MERFLSAFRGVILQHGVRAGFATATSSAQAAATAPVRSAVSNVKPPSDIMRFVELRDADRLKSLQSQQIVRPKPGDIVEVDFINLNLNNMNKTQRFKGICIESRKGLASSSFLLRCVVDEVGMQYRFPLLAPWIKSVKIVSHRKVRRARLYYLRNRPLSESTFKSSK